jgi:flagellar basal body-associated protein FliL
MMVLMMMVVLLLVLMMVAVLMMLKKPQTEGAQDSYREDDLVTRSFRVPAICPSLAMTKPHRNTFKRSLRILP